MIINLNLQEQNLKFGVSQFAIYTVKALINCDFLFPKKIMMSK